jgi:hypothetical protein
MPPHVRWSATFQVNRILQGDFAGQTFVLVDVRDAASPSWAWFRFEAGKIYTAGFNPASSNAVKNFAVLGKEPENRLP